MVHPLMGAPKENLMDVDPDEVDKSIHKYIENFEKLIEKNKNEPAFL